MHLLLLRGNRPGVAMEIDVLAGLATGSEVRAEGLSRGALGAEPRPACVNNNGGLSNSNRFVSGTNIYASVRNV